MKSVIPMELIVGRVRVGPMASTDSDMMMGMFEVRHPTTHEHLRIISCPAIMGQVWEHVSVSAQFRCPRWEEMCWVKDLFWMPEECVIQFHPPASQYVNTHPHVLHMWRPVHMQIPMPPQWMV